jgi:deazaflavin-dependent oxidoreductase (nitroreductase family)
MTEEMDVKQFNAQLVKAFRDSGGVGEMGPVHFDRLVLLTTTGRRTGEPRTVPLGSVRTEDDALLLFASNRGAPKDPDWYRNLVANSIVTVEVTGATWQTWAQVLEGDERDEAYRRWVEMAPHVADHQDKAGRQIPMVRIPPA